MSGKLAALGRSSIQCVLVFLCQLSSHSRQRKPLSRLPGGFPSAARALEECSVSSRQPGLWPISEGEHPNLSPPRSSVSLSTLLQSRRASESRDAAQVCQGPGAGMGLGWVWLGGAEAVLSQICVLCDCWAAPAVHCAHGALGSHPGLEWFRRRKGCCGWSVISFNASPQEGKIWGSFSLVQRINKVALFGSSQRSCL